MRHKRIISKKGERGFSLIEVLIASAVFSITIAGTISLQNYTLNKVVDNNDKAFAIEKSVQMFNELRAMVEGNRETTFENLSNFSDGSKYNYVLTVQKKVTPNDPLSANESRANGWKFTRQVQILPVPHDAFAKQVKVAIWYSDASGNPVNESTPLAVISGILKTNLPVTPPSQEMNIFGMAIANTLPHYQVFDELIPSFQSIVDSLEFRNPGLKLNRDLITISAYGRDSFYLPFYNDQTNTSTVHTPWVYHYPGKVLVDNTGEFPGDPNRVDYLYDYLGGRVWGETAATQNHISHRNGSKAYRPFAMADQFNHALRFPEHRAMESRVQAWAKSAIDPNTATIDQIKLRNSLLQPTLYSFLEDLNSRPNRYRNSILVSMHGNSLPVPPSRNYSDPARLPVDQRASGAAEKVRYDGMRVVTHPQQLQYENTDTMKWRVYAYKARPYGCSTVYSVNYQPSGLPYTVSGTPTANECTSTEDRSTNDVVDNMMNYAVDTTTLFIPTDGAGPSGYLDNPNLTSSTDLNAIKNNLSLSKVVGSRNRQYETMTLSTGTTARPYMGLTKKDRWPSGQTLTQAKTDGFQIIGTNGVVAKTANSLTFTRDFFGQTDAVARDAYRDLINQRIVIGAKESDTFTWGDDDNEVLRVKSVEFVAPIVSSVPTRVKFTFFDSVPDLSSVPDNTTAARRKDYEIVTSNDDPSAFAEYGHDRKGVIVRLFDTAVYHHMHDNGAASGGNRYPDERLHRLGAATNTGLPPSARLYFQEYIPASVSNNTLATAFDQDLVNTGSRTSFDPDLANETDSDLDKRAKNTARWVVSLSPVTNLDNKLVTMETRFGQNITDGVSGDGDGYEFDNPSTTTVNENRENLRLNPYNVSRTYIYRGNYYSSLTGSSNKVPFMESFQFMGDPRYMPYADVKLRGDYNKYHYQPSSGSNFKFGTGGTQWGGYSGFEAPGLFGDMSSLNGSKIPLPYTDGIMKAHSIFGSLTIRPGFFFTLGGEICGWQKFKMQYYVKAQNYRDTVATGNLYNKNGDANSVCDLPETNLSNASARLPMSIENSAGGTKTTSNWVARLDQGELFPDEQYEFWLRNGNLPNLAYVEANRRNTSKMATDPAPWGDVQLSTSAKTNGSSENKFFRAFYPDTPFRLSYRGTGPTGAGDSGFWNGSSNTQSNSTEALKITVEDNQLVKLTDGDGEAGRYLSDAFNLVMPKEFRARHTFQLSGAGAGGNDDWDSTAKPRRNTYRFMNVTGPDKGTTTGTRSNFNTNYYFDGDSVRLANAIIKATRPGGPGVTADTSLGGYYSLNAVAPSADFSATALARVLLASNVQAFLEGGDVTAPFGDDDTRIVPIPRVEITSPIVSEIVTGTVNVQLNVSWKRWDHIKYSPSYPDTFYDPTPLYYQAMYSDDNGKTWYYVKTGTVVDPSRLNKLNTSQLVVNSSAQALLTPETTKSFNWNMSGLPDANYLLRVQVFREGFENGVGYHQVLVTKGNN